MLGLFQLGMCGKALDDGTEFTIARDNDDNLQRIADGGEIFMLDLTWRAESSAGNACDEGAGGDNRLESVWRKAGSFSETLTPSYNEEEPLTGVQIARNSNGVQDVIEENYGSVHNQLLGGLTRLLNNQNLVDEQLQLEAGADNRRIQQRIGQVGAATTAGTDQYTYDPILGNLSQIERRDGSVRTFVWDGFRRLREIRDDGTVTATYSYDHQQRRIRAAHPAKPKTFGLRVLRQQGHRHRFVLGHRPSAVDPRHRPRCIGAGLYQGPSRGRPRLLHLL